jgi:hypothetical protein
MMTFGGLVPLILVNLVVMVITTTASTFRRLNAGSVAAALATVTFATVWLVGHNSGHNAYLASHLVSVTVAPSDQLPASSTSGTTTATASSAGPAAVAGRGRPGVRREGGPLSRGDGRRSCAPRSREPLGLRQVGDTRD